MSTNRVAFRFPWRRTRDIEREVAEELQVHLDQRVEELVAGGMECAAARRRAEAEFGDLAGTAAYCVAQGRGQERQRERQRWLTDLARDIRQGWRGMARRPGFTALAVVTLALGIGGTTALGTVVHRLLIRPFDLPWGDRLYLISEAQAGSRVQLYPSASTLAAWRDGSTAAFESVESAERAEMALGGDEAAPALMVPTLAASPGLAAMMAIVPEAGRWFTPEEFGPAPARVAILGHRLWVSRFGGDTSILGRTISLQGSAHLVVGIMPARAERIPITSLRAQVWLPGADWTVPGNRRGLSGFAVLRQGASVDQARAQLDAVNLRLAEADPRFETWKARMTPASDMLSDSTRTGMVTLLAASGLLLLLGCANVAQMLLARGIERRQEYGMRAALGASRGRLVRQALAEHLALGLLGGAVGAGFAWLLVVVGVRVLPDNLAALEGFEPGPALMVGAILLGLATVLAFGLYPAVEAAVRQGRAGGSLASGSQGRITGRGRGTLLAVQMTIAAVILVGAALLSRSMLRFSTRSLGFDSDGVVTWSVRIPDWRYPSPEARIALLDRINAALANLPEIASVSRSSSVPPNSGVTFGELELGDRTLRAEEQVNFFPTLFVDPAFFPTMRSELVAGRFLQPERERELPGATVVSRSLAERFWPVGGAVGQRFRVGGGDWMTIVGVVEDVPAIGLTEMDDKPHFYALAPRSWESSSFVARVTGDPDAALRSVAAAIREIEPEIVLVRAGLVRDGIMATVAGPQFFHRLLGIFALSAMAIAATGLVGIVRHAVAQRSREMAVRLALGAVPAALHRLVVRQALLPVLAGLALGALLARWGARFLTPQLHGIDPHDGVAFVGATALLLVVATLAAWWPARRVTRIEPMATLRAD